MEPADLEAEVWAALRTDVTRVADSCFVSNRAIPELRRHGTEAVKAIERVVRSPEFGRVNRSERLIERNLLHLLLVYFEVADTHGQDATAFLGSLEGTVLHQALVAVFQLWGPGRRANRRHIMPRALYETWHTLTARDPDWIGDRAGLSRGLADGSLKLV